MGSQLSSEAVQVTSTAKIGTFSLSEWTRAADRGVFFGQMPMRLVDQLGARLPAVPGAVRQLLV
jgi:hypothetical protein